MATRRPRIGILTGGGDAPGLNAVIRAVVRASASEGFECHGLEDGFDGLAAQLARPLTPRDVAGIHRLGGTVLGTSNRGTPLSNPASAAAAEGQAYGAACVKSARALGLDALIAVGGDGTLAIAHALQSFGLPTVGVPKTIDNDVVETSMTFGFDSAVSFATEAIDRLHATADAHHRTMVVEVMGRNTGWIGLHAAIGGGADVALIPEIPFHYDRVASFLEARKRGGSRCSIVVVSEGASPAGGAHAVVAPAEAHRLERLGGMAERVAATLQPLTGQETRFDVLGHLQRGGPPTSFDRVLGTRFGAFAVDLVRRGTFGVMVALRGADLATVPLDQVVGRTRPIPQDGDLIQTARAIGMSLGD